MNYFAHGFRFVDDPYFLAGTALPDWLNVADRRVRLRARHAREFVNDEDPRVAALARGIVRHHRDDAWFHETRAFAELSWHLTVETRNVLDADDGFRPSFLGHILVEILLDAALITANPARLSDYERAIGSVDGRLVQEAVNRMSPRKTDRLAILIARFSAERFLWDYPADGKLTQRLNQVMRRVGLPPLPETFRRVLPDARRQVRGRQAELLTPKTPSSILSQALTPS
ncbi:MAG: hypothetical protein ACYC35_13760 [Pirellulales bacterium]